MWETIFLLLFVLSHIARANIISRLHTATQAQLVVLLQESLLGCMLCRYVCLLLPNINVLDRCPVIRWLLYLYNVEGQWFALWPLQSTHGPILGQDIKLQITPNSCVISVWMWMCDDVVTFSFYLRFTRRPNFFGIRIWCIYFITVEIFLRCNL